MTGPCYVTYSAKVFVRTIATVVETVKKAAACNSHFYRFTSVWSPAEPRRAKHEKANEFLSKEFAQQPKVAFIHPDWENFIQLNGTISHRDTYDLIHPTGSGYAKLADPLSEELQSSLQTFPKTKAPSSSPVEEP
ncbi:Platelet activating factor acetylhydrolase IB [Fasciola hepatica]|uniref:Platelet activating factor acetylhydrolase IB n=1 Tax=Fasciola hepatica TaxID=6192 RepID=A0A4E0RCE5_FASHE|nr:Platelet activating factor acetylhydrolase IB [Fasciola hepatica]